MIHIGTKQWINLGSALLAASVSAEIGQTATVVGNILMLGGAGTTVVLLPSIVVGLLALSGAWIAGAVKAVFVQSKAAQVGSKCSAQA